MKIRTGFVSNSSSSSFIIAIDITKNKPCPHCGRSNPDILALIETASCESEDNDVNAIGYDDVMKSFKENTWRSEEEIKKLISKIEEYESNPKYKMASINISYHNEALNTILNTMVKNKEVIIVSKGD